MTTTEYNSAVAYFLSFCVEIYKKAHSISGKAALDRLMKSGAMQFLETKLWHLGPVALYQMFLDAEIR